MNPHLHNTDVFPGAYDFISVCKTCGWTSSSHSTRDEARIDGLFHEESVERLNDARENSRLDAKVNEIKQQFTN